jgi:hypothetical protein
VSRGRCVGASDRFERRKRFSREFNQDAIAGVDLSATEHNRHDASFSYEVAIAVSVQRCIHQTFLNTVQLGAWIAKTRDADDGLGADAQLRAGWKVKQIDTAGRDVLAPKLVVQLGVEQVDLAQIRLSRITANARPMLNGLSAMRISLNTNTFDEPDAAPGNLRHRMTRA